MPDDLFHILIDSGIAKVSHNGKEITFLCPFHDDHSPSASMNSKTGAWCCYGCGAKGGLKHLLGDTVFSAVNGDDGTSSVSTLSVVELLLGMSERTDTVKEHSVPVDESVVDKFAINWDLVFDTEERPSALNYPIQRGFTRETLVKFGMGYDRVSRRVTFPVRNIDGKLIGVKGRSVDGQMPKYMILRGDGFGRYRTGDVVFLLHDATPNLVVCEGEFDAIMLRQNGVTGAVALGGSHLTRRQRDLILSKAKSVTLFLDSDSAGENGQREIIDALEKWIPVRVVGSHEGDPADLGVEAVSLIKKAESSITRSI